jgi:hypothetical protein
MPRIDDRLGFGAITAVPTLTAPVAASEERSAGRVPLLELLVVGLLVLMVVPTLIVTARQQVNAERAQAVLTVTSDPSDASVIVDDLWVGRTPLQLRLTTTKGFSLRVEAREPYLEYDLYKPYRTNLQLEGNKNLHVWIPRTTAEEQAAQIAGRQH